MRAYGPPEMARKMRAKMRARVVKSDELDMLAERIVAEHRQASLAIATVIEQVDNAVGHARNVGRLLLEAKGKIKHGQWKKWVKANCPFSVRSAETYMKLARDWTRLSKAQRVALLGGPLRAAQQLLASRRSTVRGKALRAPLGWGAPNQYILWIHVPDRKALGRAVAALTFGELPPLEAEDRMVMLNSEFGAGSNHYGSLLDRWEAVFMRERG